MPNQTPITWDDIKTKYPEQRHDMSPEQETQFVNDCFTCYENEGFANTFWTPYEDRKDKISQSFKVISRCTTETHDLCTLPMWNIQFEDGTVTTAYPEEIILREMKANGYKHDINAQIKKIEQLINKAYSQYFIQWLQTCDISFDHVIDTLTDDIITSMHLEKPAARQTTNCMKTIIQKHPQTLLRPYQWICKYLNSADTLYENIQKYLKPTDTEEFKKLVKGRCKTGSLQNKAGECEFCYSKFCICNSPCKHKETIKN